MLNERCKINKKVCKLWLLLQGKKIICMGCLVTQDGLKMTFVQDKDVLIENEEIYSAFNVKTGTIVQRKCVIRQNYGAHRKGSFSLPDGGGAADRVKRIFAVEQLDHIEG